MKITIRYRRFTPLLFASLYFFSCKNEPSDIPFPHETEFAEPVTTAVSLSKPIPISWPDSFSSFSPQVRSFDLEKLPLRIFDSAAFGPFSKKPAEVKFDWAQLRDTVFDYEKLPSKKLIFENFLLDPPKLIRSGHPSSKKGSSAFLFELGEAQGVLGSLISSLFEDRDGFIWIATEKAVYRYDGENLLKYFTVPSNELISKILEDDRGRVWVATTGYNSDGIGLYIIDEKAAVLKHLSVAQGLGGDNIIDMVFDHEGRVWVTYYPYEGLSIIDENRGQINHFSTDHGLSLPAPRGLMADDKNNMWISTRGGGMNIVDLTHGKIKYLKKENGLLNDSLMNMVMDSQKNVWISTRLGYLNYVDLQHGLIRQYGKDQGLSVNFNSNLICDTKGNIWMGTNNFDKDRPPHGLEIIDPVLGRIKTLRIANGLNSDEVITLLQDKRDQIWMGTTNGLNIIYRDGNFIEKVGKKEVSTIAEDAQGRIWIGYVNSGKGIEVLDPRTGFSRSFSTAQGLSNDSIQNILVHHGAIWIATNGGIDVIDSGMHTIRHLPNKDVLKSRNPAALFAAGEGNVWMGKFFSPGIDKIDIKKNRISHLSFPSGLKDSTIIDMKSDARGHIWLAAATGGIYMIDTNKNTIQYLDNKNLLNIRSNKFLYDDDNDNIWIGTTNGIDIVNARRDSITHISEREGLVSNYVNALNGFGNQIYVGTLYGVTLISLSKDSTQKWQIVSFGKNYGFDKLSSSSASNLATRDGKFIWGDMGLTILDGFDPVKKSSNIHITGIDIFNQSQYFRSQSGKMNNDMDSLWSTAKDSFWLRGQFPSNTLYPQQEKMQWDSVSSAFHMPLNLRLPYYQNYLQFHFSASDLGAKDTTWYRYILLGADNKWSSRTNNSYSQNYLNLSPGNYVFKVSAMYRGNWSEPAEFLFTILPPWWMTWWAYVMDFFVVSGLAWIFARYRSRRLKRENLVLENKIKQRTKQLESSLDELKTTQTQLIQSEKMASLGELTAGIAHEIQNPLNFVNNFSEVNLEMNMELREKLNTIKMDAEDKKELNELMTNIEENEKKIVHHGRRADSIVKSMLLHSRSNSGIKEPADLNAMADEYMRLSYHGIRAKDKMFNSKMQMQLDEAVGKVDIVPNDFGRVLLNLYNNAFYAVGEKKKLQPEGFDPLVSVSTKRLNGKVEIRVKDNGGGISQKIMDKIFQPFYTTKPTGQGTGLGLSLSYDIIKAHGGDLKVETTEGKGSDFIITIPAAS